MALGKKYESVKISKKVVDSVRKSKEKTGVPIGYFFEIAAEEKLALSIDGTSNTCKKKK